MESKLTVPRPENLIDAFFKSFAHHQKYPTKHGLLLFISNVNLALGIISHAHDDLVVLKMMAEELLRKVETEDQAVAEFERVFSSR